MIKIPSTWSIGHIRLDMNTPIILPKIKRALQRILRKILAVFYFGGFLWYLKCFKDMSMIATHMEELLFIIT